MFEVVCEVRTHASACKSEFEDWTIRQSSGWSRPFSGADFPDELAQRSDRLRSLKAQAAQVSQKVVKVLLSNYQNFRVTEVQEPDCVDGEVTSLRATASRT